MFPIVIMHPKHWKELNELQQTKRQKRLDEIAKEQGWTHRLKRKSRDAYLKAKESQTLYEGKLGGIFIDMDQKFRYIEFDEVTEL
jgi:hypothetical protein